MKVKENDVKDQLLLSRDKVTQLEEQNLELRKAVKSLTADFNELDEIVVAMNKKIKILQARLQARVSQQQRLDVDGGHPIQNGAVNGAFQNYREWYGFYGLIEDHRRIVFQNNHHLQLQEITNHEP